MFAKTIVLSDAFLDMPLSARCLYFTLGMFADDEGFVNSPKGIMRQCGASQDDMNILLARKFLLMFESGVIVIKHWRINNYLRNDRFQETKYVEERDSLVVDENGSYTLGIPSMGIPNIDKDSIGKNSIDKDIYIDEPKPPKEQKHKHGEYQKVLLTDKEFTKLADDYGVEMRDRAIKFLDAYIEEKGYKSKSHNLAIRRWVIDAVQKNQKPKSRSQFDELMNCEVD